MDLSILRNTARQLARTVTKHSPTILTALGITGFVSTVIMAVRATPKAIEILDYERDFRYKEYGTDYNAVINIPDTIELTWKVYAPSTLMGVTSIACIIGATSINNRRNVALSSLFAVAESTLKEYQAKVVSTIGESKERKIRSEISGDELKKNPLEPKAIIVSGLGDTLCYDQYTGRYFKGDVETIKKTINEFNHRLLKEMQLPLNDLYFDLGLEAVESGRDIGWDVERGLIEIDISAKLASGDVPCVVLTFKNKPTKLW
jgi:hypothetical protein